MELEKIEKQVSNIKKHLELVVNQYKSIINSLDNMYSIVIRTDALTAKKIKELINRYNLMLRDVADNYVNSTKKILEYVEQTRLNLEQLAQDIRKSAMVFGESLVNVDITKSP